MEQHITTSPSSNTWIKFEGSDEGLESNKDRQLGSSSGSHISSYSHSVESDSPTLIPQAVAFKAHMKDSKSYPNINNFMNYSRYSAFDSLRFGQDNINQFGWRRNLVGEEEGTNESLRSTNYGG